MNAVVVVDSRTGFLTGSTQEASSVLYPRFPPSWLTNMTEPLTRSLVLTLELLVMGGPSWALTPERWLPLCLTVQKGLRCSCPEPGGHA